MKRTPLKRKTPLKAKSSLKRGGFSHGPRKTKTGLRSAPTYKIKVWKTTYTDAKFSRHIRERDGKCMRCGCTDKPLDCSHYWKRGDKGTRFDPRNCIALCRDCHTIWERQKNNEYKDFMLKWLGKEEYDDLETLARTCYPLRDAVIKAMSWL